LLNEEQTMNHRPTLPSHAHGARKLQRWPALATAFAAAISTAVLGAMPAFAADKASSHARIEARYQAERKACLEGRTGQDQATCLKDAGAARAEALRQRLDNGESREALAANALLRCAVQPASERAACEMLARGQGMEQGSVREGGVIKEVITRSVGTGETKPVEPLRPASPASAAERAAPASAPASWPQPTR
jgi:hypothetical protein